MLPFFSPKRSNTELVAGRAIVTAFALLFLLCGLFRTLPDGGQISEFLEENALAGHEQIVETTQAREPVLEEFYDRPSDEPRSFSADAPTESTVGSDAKLPDLPKKSGSV